MKRLAIMGLVGLFALFGVYGALTALDSPKAEAQQEAPADAPADGAAAPGGMPPAPKVTAARPLVTRVSEWQDFTGRFEAADSVEIRSRVSGYLTSVHFQEGSLVKKGDLLFIIDPRTLEATLRQKEADLNLAKSQVGATENDFERAEALFKSGDVSAQLLDQRRAARDQARAAVDSAKAALDAARVDIAYTKIHAPIAGRISRKLVTEGNLVNPGQDVLTTIMSMDPIYFYFDVDEQTYLNYARANPDKSKDTLNIPVRIALSDEQDFRHEGVVDFIDNALNTSTGTIRVRAVLENPKLYFTPGMFGRVRIRTGGSDNGILIPDQAIMIDQSRKYVYVVGDDGMVATRTIETGGLDQGLRIVTSGLDGSEWVIINGLQRVGEGAPAAPEKTTITPQADAGTPLPVPDDAATPAEPAPAAEAAQ